MTTGWTTIKSKSTSLRIKTGLLDIVGSPVHVKDIVRVTTKSRNNYYYCLDQSTGYYVICHNIIRREDEIFLPVHWLISINGKFILARGPSSDGGSISTADHNFEVIGQYYRPIPFARCMKH